MLGSQVLEVAIGLAAAFFIVATLASSVVEAISKKTKKRATDLENTLMSLFEDGGSEGLFSTSVFQSLMKASSAGVGSGTKPSYVSAKAFTDASVEVLGKLKAGAQDWGQLVAALPDGLWKERLAAVGAEVNGDLTKLRAGLETWFDDMMDRVEEAYKKWAQVILLVTGLAIAVGLNVSTTGIAIKLWDDTAVRQAVADAATDVGSDTPLSTVAETVSALDELGVPFGWSSDALLWSTCAGAFPCNLWMGLLQVLGWGATGILVMLGAPFWFEALTKLASMRSSGRRPPRAGDEPGSAVAELNLRMDPSHPTETVDELFARIPTIS